MKRATAFRRVLSNRRVVAAEVGFGSFAIVLHGAWVAVVVFAFQRGGVGEAGLVSFLVLSPAALAGPFVTVWFNRLPARWTLAVGIAGQAATLALVAIAVAANVPRGVVYGLLVLFSTAQMSTRPTMATILPSLVDDPEQLAASNSVTELIETVGLVVGPALAGLVLLTFDGEAAPFAAGAFLLMAGAVAASLIGDGPADAFADGSLDRESFWESLALGRRAIGDSRSLLYLVILLSSIRLVVGTLEVAVVPLAVDQLNRDNATAGFLASAIGIGGILGAAFSVLLIGRRRLSGPIALGLLLACAPVILAAAVTSTAPMVALFVVAGVGRPLLVVGGRTLLQGLSAEDTLAQLFGFLEGLSLLTVALGSALFSLVAVVANLEIALLVTGGLPIAILALLYRPMRAIDQSRPPVDANLVSALRSIPIFSTLPAFRIEQLMISMGSGSYAPDEPVFHLGDYGHRFHLVSSGSAVVELTTSPRVLTAGGFFGEIALLRDQPRMATVRAGAEGLQVYTLERRDFLAAVSSVPSSARRADRVIEHRLADGAEPETD